MTGKNVTRCEFAKILFPLQEIAVAERNGDGKPEVQLTMSNMPALKIKIFRQFS